MAATWRAENDDQAGDYRELGGRDKELENADARILIETGAISATSPT
jgi:hypothetical protein